MRERSGAVATAAVLAIGALVGGCGDDSSEEVPAAVDVVATEYAFDLPSEISGGWVTMNLTNEGAEPHEYALARLEGGHTIDELESAIEKTGQPPKWVKEAGNLGIQTGGASTRLSFELTPGDYELLCFLPGPEGKSHLELGMKRGFTVSGDSGESPPQADSTVAVTKKGYEVPAIASGEQTLGFEGASPSFELVQFDPGKGFDDVDAWAQKGFRGEAPATLFGGASFPSGQAAFLTQDFDAGASYSLVNPDTRASQEFTPE